MSERLVTQDAGGRVWEDCPVRGCRGGAEARKPSGWLTASPGSGGGARKMNQSGCRGPGAAQ